MRLFKLSKFFDTRLLVRNKQELITDGANRYILTVFENLKVKSSFWKSFNFRNLISYGCV